MAGEFEAVVERMGRSEVEVRVGAHHAVDRASAREVHLAIGMPANERMDWLVEKATELGAASIQPLMSERSVLRLNAERAEKKMLHWQGVAIAACEQCGGNTVPAVHAAVTLVQWLATPAPAGSAGPARWLLSLRPGTKALRTMLSDASDTVFLCGPEGGFTPQEENAACHAGFQAVSLGARVLRSETAALTALALLV